MIILKCDPKSPLFYGRIGRALDIDMCFPSKQETVLIFSNVAGLTVHVLYGMFKPWTVSPLVLEWDTYLDLQKI